MVAQPGEPARLLRQPGRVVGLEDGMARIAVDPVAACRGCAARSGCASRAVMDMGGHDVTEMRLPASTAMRMGDPVCVTMPGADFVVAAALALLLPAAAFVAAIWLCSVLAIAVLPAALLCATAMLIALWPVVRSERSGRLVARLQVEPAVASPVDPA